MFRSIITVTRVSWSCVVAIALLLVPAAHAQDSGQCRVVEVDMTPTPDLQIVMWLEDDAGNYVATLFITDAVGRYGLGNRPGILEFNSAWAWPYGRRETTFPVWAHRHGIEWPRLVFQNADDRNLSHPLGQSSREHHFCRPLREGEAQWDTLTCTSTVFTDKGRFSDTETSRYPPRSDLTESEGVDDPVVDMFSSMNPFDAVSRPTPPGDLPFQTVWPIPETLPDGDYVLWVEVSKEFDQNQSYDFPPPPGIPWSDYGLPARGQPSVVYRVPFTISPDNSVAMTADYAGYGDPGEYVTDGVVVVDGLLRPPDTTITTGVDGSGGSRLALTAVGGDLYRVRVGAMVTEDHVIPGVPEELRALAIDDISVQAAFYAPGDDDQIGTVAGYEVRYVVADSLTEDNFFDARLAPVTIAPEAPGLLQEFTFTGLTSSTRYTIGVRAFDECKNYGELAVVEVATSEPTVGEVDWCFVATAAYGSILEQDVAMLRRFRDRFLRTHATGELLVESYYTFGPALAKLIGPSDTLRRAARASLAPLVETVRALAPAE